MSFDFSFDDDFEIDLADVKSRRVVQPPGKISRLLEHVPGTEHDYVLSIDWSGLSNYLLCPQRFEYNNVHSRNGGISAALYYGRAIHKALEFLYGSRHHRVPVEPSGIAVSIDTVLQDACVDLDWRNPERAYQTMRKYLDKYGNEPYTVLDYEGHPFIERPFSFSIIEMDLNTTLAYGHNTLVHGADPDNNTPVYVGKLTINWVGVIDLALKSSSNAIWLMDHKTCSRFGDSYRTSWNLSGQFIGYCEAFRVITGVKPEGLIGNFVIGRRPSEKGTGKPIEFDRQHYVYTDWQYDKWRSNISILLERVVYSLMTGKFEENPMQCDGKFGLCPYFDVCRQNPFDNSRAVVLGSDAFTNNTWNPLELNDE